MLEIAADWWCSADKCCYIIDVSDYCDLIRKHLVWSFEMHSRCDLCGAQSKSYCSWPVIDTKPRALKDHLT